MLEHSGDLFKRRAARLGLERGDALIRIQTYLEKLYPAQTRALSLQNGMLKIHALNSPVASELRMRHTELLRHIQSLSPTPITKIVVQIRG